MKIATWNVNSLNVRLPHVLDWLEKNPVDVLALQELKLTDEKFPAADLERAGYHALSHGQPTYNGVALLSRTGIENLEIGIPGYEDEQARVIAGTISGVRVICVYVPNGSEVGSDKYEYKLDWLEALRIHLETVVSLYPSTVLLGDFNVAPRPEDTHDPEKWEGGILCSPPERIAFQGLLDAGLEDCWRLFDDREGRHVFTWWDYRNGGWARNAGLRIDHVLASAPLVEVCKSCHAHVGERGRKRPSDHVPVVAEFDIR